MAANVNFHNMDYLTRGDARSAADQLHRLLSVMQALRDPTRGCPWDQVQDFDSIAPYTIEESYEVADAIRRKDWAALPDELGDLLFQVVYHARMAEEAGLFDFADVARSIADKMIRRHPHVFGNQDQVAGWEEQKLAERRARNELATLDGLATGMPALTRALKVTSRAAKVGFDWTGLDEVLRKLEEEVAEVRAELPAALPARMQDEIGDILFVAANLARKAGLDPETCLHDATDKFTRRFNEVERRLSGAGYSLAEAGLDRMEAEWAAVKRDEQPG